MGLGTPIATPPIRRGTSRPFQRAIENQSTTSGGFKTFTLKISMVYAFERYLEHLSIPSNCRHLNTPYFDCFSRPTPYGFGYTHRHTPIRRGTSRPFQRAIENLSTTSGAFKTFTLKISMGLSGLEWFMVYGFFSSGIKGLSARAPLPDKPIDIFRVKVLKAPEVVERFSMARWKGLEVPRRIGVWRWVTSRAFERYLEHLSIPSNCRHLNTPYFDCFSRPTPYGFGYTHRHTPIRRGTSRPFQRAIENLSTTSGAFKTFTLKISMGLSGLEWFMVYGFFSSGIKGLSARAPFVYETPFITFMFAKGKLPLVRPEVEIIGVCRTNKFQIFTTSIYFSFRGAQSPWGMFFPTMLRSSQRSPLGRTTGDLAEQTGRDVTSYDSTDQIVLEGSSFSLTCVYDSSTSVSPDIVWYLDGEALSSDSDVETDQTTSIISVYTVSSAEVGSEGSYACQANYKDGSTAVGSLITSGVGITVNGFLFTPASNYSYFTGAEDVAFSCVIRSDSSPDTLVWTKDGTQMNSDNITTVYNSNTGVTTSTLTLDTVETSNDGQDVVCSASWDDISGSISSSASTLNVNSQGLRKVYARITQGLHKEYARNTLWFRIEYARDTVTQELRNDYAKKTQEIRMKIRNGYAICVFSCEKLTELVYQFVDHCLGIITLQEHRIVHADKVRQIQAGPGETLITSTAWRNGAGVSVGGVGVLMRTEYSKLICEIRAVSHRILAITLAGNPKLTVISVYSPTECANVEEVEKFHHDLRDYINTVPAHNLLVVAGDFNARIGWEDSGFGCLESNGGFYTKDTHENTQIAYPLRIFMRISCVFFA
eukprot:sb/3462117/